MVDTRFSVQLDEVAATVRRLGAVERHLGRATARLGDLDPRLTGDVTAALHGFADHWEHGVQALHRTVGALHEALSTAHAAYAEHDAALAEQLRP